MALARDRKRINVKGGGKIQLRELDPSPSNTYLDLGYLVSNTLTDEHTMVESVDESGQLVNSQTGARKVTWKTVIKQTTADEINLLKNAGTKLYEVYYNVTMSNTYVQMLCLLPVRIKPSVVLDFASATERTLEVEFHCLVPKAAYTRGVTTFNVVANEPYVLVDASSETFNTSNTEASAIASAVI